MESSLRDHGNSAFQISHENMNLVLILWRLALDSGLMKKRFLICIGLCSLWPHLSSGQKHPVTVKECVQVRRIEDWGSVSGGVAIAPNGSKVAYMVHAPNLSTNQGYKYELYVRDLKDRGQRKNGRLLTHLIVDIDSNPGLRWLADSERVAVLARNGTGSEISFIDVRTGKREIQVSRTAAIDDYSVSDDGEVIAFAMKVPAISDVAEEQRKLRGYVVSFGQPAHYSETPRREIYIARKSGRGERSLTKVVNDDAPPGSKAPVQESAFGDGDQLSLSPDGNYLTFRRGLGRGLDPVWDAIPESWKSNPTVKMLQSADGYLETLALYDLRAHHLSFAIDSPHADQKVFWSGDSRAFFVSVVPPVTDVYWTTFDVQNMHAIMGSSAFNQQVYTVNVQTRSFSQVLPGLSNREEAPVSWKQADGEMMVHLGHGIYARIVWRGKWQEARRYTNEGVGAPSSSRTVTSNGDVVVGVYETPASPPELFLQNFGSNEMVLLTDLNPELREAALGGIESLEWSNKYGARTSGYLIKPVGYQESKRYPLIILAYGWGDKFVCDGGGSEHTTAFPPQPLAAAGFLVLMANAPRDEAQPKNYPGELGEAYNWIAMVESAIDLLSDRGIADKKKVGLVGWSRTSWKTDFLLTHSDLQLAAASSADGGIFNYGWYWSTNIPEEEMETMLGGPPYGDTFQNWLNYSPAFSATKARTPLLIEATSQGGFLNSPINAYEFFAALHRQGKPVELYFYPNGQHALDSPFERVASLQRNVDWFRFWLQGYEGKAPDYDPDQYSRWRKLREQHEWNERIRAQGKDPSAEFLRQTTPGAVLGNTETAPAAYDKPN